MERLPVEAGRCPMPESSASCGTIGPTSWRCAMSALLVGYARCSTDQQDLTAQRDALSGLGVEFDRIYVDHGLTGTKRERPGVREALAVCRAGDTLVVTKLDRLARSCPTPEQSPTNSPPGRSASRLVGRSTTPPTPSVGCCSTCSRWWLSRVGPDPASYQDTGVASLPHDDGSRDRCR